MSEGYPRNWRSSIIHLNPETGEMHSDSLPARASAGADDGDHFVRHWMEEKLRKNKELEKALAELLDGWHDSLGPDRRKWGRFGEAVKVAERLLGRDKAMMHDGEVGPDYPSDAMPLG